MLKRQTWDQGFSCLHAQIVALETSAYISFCLAGSTGKQQSFSMVNQKKQTLNCRFNDRKSEQGRGTTHECTFSFTAAWIFLLHSWKQCFLVTGKPDYWYIVFVLKLACCVYYYGRIRSDFDQIYEKGKDKFPPKACTYFAVNGAGSGRLVLDRERVKWSIIKPATIWFHQRQMPQPWVTWGKTRMFHTDMWKNNESDRKHETLQLLTPNYCPVYIYGHTSMFRETGVHVIA